MLTPHVTSMSGLPSAHAYEQGHNPPGATSNLLPWVVGNDSLIGDSHAPAEYSPSAESEPTSSSPVAETR
jgi:hypothetical protein